MANFRFIEKITSSQDLLGDIKDMLTNPAYASYPFNETAGEVEVANEWEVDSEVLDTTTGKIKELIVKTTASIGSTPVLREFYVKFTNNCFDNEREHSSLTVQVLADKDDTDWNIKGHPVNYEWADEQYKDGAKFTDRDSTKPVYMYANYSNNRIAMVLVGDPAVHFNDYRKSFLYVGSIVPFKGLNEDDAFGNVLLTAGAVADEGTTLDPLYDYGQYTSKGNNTFQMLGTKSGIRFQRHYPAFITQVPQPGKAYVDPKLGDTGLLLEPQGFNASAWTRKYHLSPIYVVHPYDGYRGSLDGVISVSKNNILHLDELIVDIPPGTEGKTWRQEVYQYFDHNTEQNFMNRSANVKAGLAILKEVRY